MLEDVNAAFERKDYQTAAKLIKQLLQDAPENPLVQFYLGQLYEVSGKRLAAEKIYRQVLRLTTNTKILTQARQGLQRLDDIKQEEKQRAIAQAIAEPNNTELGILVLKPISHDLKTKAAQNFAQIMGIDPYTARLILPSRCWRVYRLGKLGELEFYGHQLQQANIPCFWVRISQIEKIQVFQVKHFSVAQPKATVICCNQENQLGSLTFDWSEVTAKVMGMLPIFEQVVDVNARHQLERKTKTQDYYQFCDLHLPQRNCILRIYDNGYNYHDGLEIISKASQNTIRINWNNLTKWLDIQLPKVKLWSDFTPFGQTVLDNTELLNQITSHIHLFRREKTPWDSAFQLYSSLVFLK
ncbi:hypothetical protein B6N60_02475 [Richelia sinica FACHB-800]|uniref:Cyclic nucleotide-binding protein n=1 Tax=Richelia sinica FACHB-800 TaxID=1357546 RepID=A0A975T840_9NOST|nr:tetratricopeptide repeat protein [Richelia sinica]MBD2666434.1 tetratricopeptide repeat protein [Richelia sinica FACHB-800]QXE23784.1 hypothetical protein B6N60_02475 [Richelia sinica FACHB-800]